MIDDKTKETIKSAFGKIDENRAALRNPSFDNPKAYERASRATMDAGVDIAFAYIAYQNECEARCERPMNMEQFMKVARQG